MNQGALHHFLVSPPTDPAAPPLIPQTQLPYPGNDDAYTNNLNRKKCSLLTGKNTRIIVRK